MKKNTKDPEEWIAEFKELRYCLEDMGLIMADEDLMIPILNNLPSGYELQVEQTEGKINQYDNPLT